ncbi:MAG TPA: hypothetical protein ENO24_03660 [Chloroflexi bacterium]|nr:hypothetical protein [Chloroflexota bacterium]
MKREIMHRSRTKAVVSVLSGLGLVAMLLMGALSAQAATPPEPTYASANVDGNYGEWDLVNDFFADMYRAADPTKKVESKLYVRYDCETETLYVLVLAVDGVTVLPEPDNAFVKLGNAITLVNGNSGDDGTPPDFAWVMSNDDYIGFEASASLAPGSYNNLNVHVNVDDGGSQTSAVADRAILLDLLCTAEPDICVEKTALDNNVDPPVTLHYEYQVCNPGEVPLSNVDVTDDTCDNVQYVSGDTSPANGKLDPGETWLYTCEFLFEGPSLPGICVVNEVTAEGQYNGQTVDDTHYAVVHCYSPPEGGIQILKTVDLEHVCPGQTLIYRYEVTNLGDVPLYNITVNDDTCSPLDGPSGDSNHNNRLDPAETWIYTCRYTVTGGEPNPLENRVIASGDVMDDGQVVDTVTDRDPAIVQIVPCPQVAVEFVPEPGTAVLLASGLAGVAGYASLKWGRRPKS